MLLKMPDRQADLAKLAAIASRLRESCDTLLVVETGGSSLGARYAPFGFSNHPRLHFLENVDPETVDTVLGTLDPSKTGGLFVSKSGGTMEALGLSMIVHDWMLTGGLKARTYPSEPLRSPGAKTTRSGHWRSAMTVLCSHDPDVGGRFSVFSSVGMLPAAVAGLDTDAIREGANSVATIL